MLNINGSAYKLDTIIADTSGLKADSTLIKSALYARTGVMPNLAAAINVTPSATAWKLGAAAAIVATAGLTSAFQITGVNVESVGTTSGDMEIILYKGTAASSAVAAIRGYFATALGSAVNGFHIPVETKQIPANRSIYAKAAALTTTVPVPAISINYKMG